MRIHSIWNMIAQKFILKLSKVKQYIVKTNIIIHWISKISPNFEIKYFKITNKNEIHYGFVYKDCLNTLINKFNGKDSCVPDGLYFTTWEHTKNLWLWYKFDRNRITIWWSIKNLICNLNTYLHHMFTNSINKIAHH